jgi:hypothetical protein
MNSSKLSIFIIRIELCVVLLCSFQNLEGLYGFELVKALLLQTLVVVVGEVLHMSADLNEKVYLFINDLGLVELI